MDSKCWALGPLHWNMGRSINFWIFRSCTGSHEFLFWFRGWGILNQFLPLKSTNSKVSFGCLSNRRALYSDKSTLSASSSWEWDTNVKRTGLTVIDIKSHSLFPCPLRSVQNLMWLKTKRKDGKDRGPIILSLRYLPMTICVLFFAKI